VLKYKNGFTITELLVAIALFAIVVPLMAVGINNLTVLNNRARDLALANTIAQNKVELLRSTGFNSLIAGTVDFSDELPATFSQPRSANYTITDDSSSVKEVTVIITYKDYGSTKTIEYKSAISELGVAQ